MFKHRSQKKELMDDLSLQSQALKKNLDELATYNQWLGGKRVLLSSLERIHQKYAAYWNEHNIVIGDLGCGGGDLLRAMAEWASAKSLAVELIGVDANPFMIQYSAQQSSSNIHYKTVDIFSSDFTQIPFDIVCLNSVCHHFSDKELVHLFKQLAKQTHLAIIINDLQRHWLSYFAIKGITQLFPISPLAKHDAPLSVLRAFQKQELVHLLNQAQLNAYQIRWAWAFRWDIIAWLK